MRNLNESFAVKVTDLSIGSMVTCVTEMTFGPSRRVRVMETAGLPLPPFAEFAAALPEALEVAIRMLDRARPGDAFPPLTSLLLLLELAVAAPAVVDVVAAVEVDVPRVDVPALP